MWTTSALLPNIDTASSRWALSLNIILSFIVSVYIVLVLCILLNKVVSDEVNINQLLLTKTKLAQEFGLRVMLVIPFIR